MHARRQFLKAATLGGASVLALPGSAAPSIAQAHPKGLPAGKLCVLVYGQSMTPLPDGAGSSIVVLDVPSFKVRHVASAVSNLHGLVPLGASQGTVLGLGHESAEQIEVFTPEMTRVETRNYPGVMFRGHGLPWRDGALVAAELKGRPMDGGFLLQLDAAGREVSRHPTGGLRPHEIVRCGEYLAVAHYGNKPTAPPSGAGSLLFDLVEPGVAFLRASDLSVAAFHKTPGTLAISHLAATPSNRVLALGLNTARQLLVPALYARAAAEGATLLMSEMYEKGYEVYGPMFELDPVAGIVGQRDDGAAQMRRGQSFASDPSSGVVAAVYAASHSLFVQQRGLPAKWLSTLSFGVSNPRGCVVWPGTSLVAISGNETNVAIVDVATDKLVHLQGLPLGGHSHMFWLPD